MTFLHSAVRHPKSLASTDGATIALTIFVDEIQNNYQLVYKLFDGGGKFRIERLGQRQLTAM
jgi:hypothetical protein